MHVILFSNVWNFDLDCQMNLTPCLYQSISTILYCQSFPNISICRIYNLPVAVAISSTTKNTIQALWKTNTVSIFESSGIERLCYSVPVILHGRHNFALTFELCILCEEGKWLWHLYRCSDNFNHFVFLHNVDCFSEANFYHI